MELETKNLITSILTSTPYKMSIIQLDRDFYELVGYKIPFQKLGYQTLEQYLLSIPDTVKINGRGLNAEVIVIIKGGSAHISEMVAKQNKSKGARFRKTVRSTPRNPQPYCQNMYPNYNYNRSVPPRYMQVYIPPPRMVYQTDFGGPKSYPIKINIPNNLKPAESATPARSNSIVEKAQPDSRSAYLPPGHRPPNSRPPPPSSNLPLGHQPPDRSPPPPSSNLPPGHRPPDYNKSNKPRLPPKGEDVPDYVKNYRNTKAQENKSAKETPEMPKCPNYVAQRLVNLGAVPKKSLPPSDCEDNYESDEDDHQVPKIVRDNLRKLIGDHPEGIWCCDLPRLYSSRYGREIDYLGYGFRTLNQMCVYLGTVFHSVRPNEGDFKLYDKSKPIPLDLSLNLEKEYLDSNPSDGSVSPPPLDFENILAPKKTLTEIVPHGDEIPTQWLPEDVVVGDYLDISVAEVYDPSKFWFIMYTFRLNEIMDELQEFYGSQHENYAVPEDEVRVGLYCVTVYFKEYHRAIVISLMECTKSMVKVYFIDYGTVSAVKTSTICYLHKSFSRFPQQAMRGRLAGVYPVTENSQWPREATVFFFSLVERRELIGKVEKIDATKQIVHLTLIEGKRDARKDIFINTELVDKGLAVKTRQEQTKNPLRSKYAIPITDRLHLVPTFEELEQGIVPTITEMRDFLAKGIPLEIILPQYFKKCYYKHELKLFEEPFDWQKYVAESSSQAASDSTEANVENEPVLEQSVEEEPVEETTLEEEPEIMTKVYETTELTPDNEPCIPEVVPEVIHDRPFRPPPGFPAQPLRQMPVHPQTVNYVFQYSYPTPTYPNYSPPPLQYWNNYTPYFAHPQNVLNYQLQLATQHRLPYMNYPPYPVQYGAPVSPPPGWNPHVPKTENTPRISVIDERRQVELVVSPVTDEVVEEVSQEMQNSVTDYLNRLISSHSKDPDQEIGANKAKVSEADNAKVLSDCERICTESASEDEKSPESLNKSDTLPLEESVCHCHDQNTAEIESKHDEPQNFDEILNVVPEIEPEETSIIEEPDADGGSEEPENQCENIDKNVDELSKFSDYQSVKNSDSDDVVAETGAEIAPFATNATDSDWELRMANLMNYNPFRDTNSTRTHSSLSYTSAVTNILDADDPPQTNGDVRHDGSFDWNPFESPADVSRLGGDVDELEKFLQGASFTSPDVGDREVIGGDLSVTSTNPFIQFEEEVTVDTELSKENGYQSYVIKREFANKALHLLWIEEDVQVLVEEVLQSFTKYSMPVVKVRKFLLNRNVNIPITSIRVNELNEDLKKDLERFNILKADVGKWNNFINVVSLNEIPNLVQVFEGKVPLEDFTKFVECVSCDDWVEK